jgi:hypothetical protein
MCYFGLFVHVAKSALELIVAKSGALLFILLMVPALIEMLLVKEIRLYRDRIVKEWKLIGRRELKLAKARLVSKNMPTLGIGAKHFYEQETHPGWHWLPDAPYKPGVFYGESFADRKKVKQFNSLLAELSGRKIEEFEQTGTMERLLKRGEPQSRNL